MNRVSLKSNKEESARELEFLRKRVAELEETEDRHRTLIELGTKIGEAVVMLQDIGRKEGAQTYVSDQWPQITGYSKEELLSMSFFDLISPEDRQLSIKRHRQKISGKTIPDLFELSITRKDGSKTPIEITSAATTYKGESTNVVYIRDITERKQAEKQLKQYQQHLEKLVEERTEKLEKEIKEHANTEEEMQFMLDSAPVYILLKDRKMKYMRANRLTRDALMQKEFIGKTIYDITVIDREYCDIESQGDKTVIETGKPQEIVLKYKNKSSGSDDNWLKISRIPHKDKNGNVDRFVIMALDITGLKQAEERIKKLYYQEKKLRSKLEEQIKQRLEFTRLLVHEIKTPLSSIIASSEALVDEDCIVKKDNKTRKRLAQNILGGGLSLNKRVDELMDLSRGEVSMLKLKYSFIYPSVLLEETYESILQKVCKNGQSIILDIPPSLPGFIADYERIQQVLLNLLSNAIKFNHKEGKITINASYNDSQITFEVQDEGIGISKKDQRLLFQPYQRLKGGKDRSDGLGLGLALSKMLVDLHQGQIYVKSKINCGSTFGFSLPLKTEVLNMNGL